MALAEQLIYIGSGGCAGFALILLFLFLFDLSRGGGVFKGFFGVKDDPDYAECLPGTAFEVSGGTIFPVAVHRLREKFAGVWKYWQVAFVMPNGSRPSVWLNATPFENIHCLRAGHWNLRGMGDQAEENQRLIERVTALGAALKTQKEKAQKATWENIEQTYQVAELMEKIKQKLGSTMILSPEASEKKMQQINEQRNKEAV